MIYTQKDAEDYFRKYAPAICGSLCIFGNWFGKPYDNFHRIKSFEIRDDYLRLIFNEDETLEVWGWQGLSDNGRGFIIKHASRVRWEWFYYGRPKLPENRFFEEYIVKNDIIEAISNFSINFPNFIPSLAAPAVLIT